MAFRFTCIGLLALSLYIAAVEGNCCSVNESRLWSRNVQGLLPSAAEWLKPVLGYKFYLPEINLKGSMGYLGSSIRLRQFTSDLLSGSRPLRVGVVGGSISVGEGSSRRHVTDWFSVFSNWLGSIAKANVTFVNGAVAGTPSSYMAMCLNVHLPRDMDLVFLEYVWNDLYQDRLINNQVVMNMERLIRRILNFPRRPAVVLMQVAIVGDHMETAPFYRTSEDLEGALAAFYDASYLSMRNALYPLAVMHPTAGYSWNETFINHHPGDAGHKIMADMAAYMIQQAAISIVLNPISYPELSVHSLPLAAPMYPGNEIPPGVVCSSGRSFTEHVLSNLGWEWRNEGTPWKPKWGFVTYTPGSKLTLRVNTLRPAIDPTARIPVLIHYLSSYDKMGTALLTCSAGCVCDPKEVDATSERRVSQVFFAQIKASQSETCDVTVTLLQKTSSGGYHFKVSGVVVSASDVIDSIFFVEEIYAKRNESKALLNEGAR
ncbi:hypothetical protein Agub_g14463 [Astrephomene gubernaculifera]|uniref:SGNH hydrolase-type esterase domain-containing protein n=1 Tax=Astrephomene gubernaculifera TaxID=47775 RepID=A0AAD3E3P5_9CHLO|nr:hypothetical protein Agub_g14463 [Astrephomene gubernaculifera]